MEKLIGYSVACAKLIMYQKIDGLKLIIVEGDFRISNC